MANTTNLNLEKPIGTDQALVSVINSNMDKIDTFAGSTNQALSNVNNALSGSDIINNQSDKDLNHYVATSAWRIGNVSQLTNGPAWTLAGATGNLYVRANGTYISQTFIGSVGMASRTSFDGGTTWNAWSGCASKYYFTSSGTDRNAVVHAWMQSCHNGLALGDIACITGVYNNTMYYGIIAKVTNNVIMGHLFTPNTAGGFYFRDSSGDSAATSTDFSF